MGRPLNPLSKRWKGLRAQVIARDAECHICGGKIHLSAHHIKPRKHGGKTELRNLMCLCLTCHDFVELHDLDWSGIIKLRHERKTMGYDGKAKAEGTRLVGKDKWGVFVVNDAKPGDSITYEGTWPVKVAKVEEAYSRYGK